VIDVYLPLPDGTSKRVRAWVDSGNSEMTMSQRIAALLGFVSCDGRVCNATPPREIVIGGMKISLPGVRTASAPLTADKASDVMDPGMSAEINLPSAVLDNYDVVFDYQNREFTIGEPGTAQFKGKPTKVLIDAAGLIQIPSQIEGQSYNLALDTGASISSVSSDLLTVWHKAEPTWPFMTVPLGLRTCGAAQRKHEEGCYACPTFNWALPRCETLRWRPSHPTASSSSSIAPVCPRLVWWAATSFANTSSESTMRTASCTFSGPASPPA